MIRTLVVGFEFAGRHGLLDLLTLVAVCAIFYLAYDTASARCIAGALIFSYAVANVTRCAFFLGARAS